MRTNRAMYQEVEAAMHRLVPILVYLKGHTDAELDKSDPNSHRLKASSKVLINLKHTQHIILENALPGANDDWQRDACEIITFFDWWSVKSKSQAQLRVRLGQLSEPDFDALGKLDYWLSEKPRDLGNMRLVFDGFEDCEESIRTCVVKWRYVEGFGTALMGPPLNSESLKSVRWFCRGHPGLIESGTDCASVEEKEKDTDGFEKVVTIYPWT